MKKEDLQILIDKKLSIRQIALEFNLSVGTIRHWLKKYSLSTYHNKWNIKDLTKYGRQKIKSINQCASCSTDIPYFNKRYCSNKCQQNWEFKNVTLKKFKNGNLLSHAQQRTVLISLFGEKCSCCNIGGMWNGKKLQLQVDHKDGNRNNNNPENLRLLCPNCHTQTPTWGKKTRVTTV